MALWEVTFFAAAKETEAAGRVTRLKTLQH